MAEIVAKYGSKEKELSARLHKKYGRPLPPSVPSQELQRVLVEFGMEDQDLVAAESGVAGAATVSVAASTAAAAAAPALAPAPVPVPVPAATPVAAATAAAAPAAATGGERPPKGSELNFRSKFFDPIQV